MSLNSESVNHSPALGCSVLFIDGTSLGLESFPYPFDHGPEQASSAVIVLATHIETEVSALEGYRCQVRDKEEEDKDTREKMAELEELLRQSETHRQDLEQQLRLKEQQFSATLSGATKVSLVHLVKKFQVHAVVSSML